jgi:hypothetical protein
MTQDRPRGKRAVFAFIARLNARAAGRLQAEIDALDAAARA